MCKLVCVFAISLFVAACCSRGDVPRLSEKYYGPDREWFEENIPFIDVPDTLIMDVYYYRWAMYKMHFRNLGEAGYTITEFAPSVSWEGPYSAISAAAGHHIYEGRWLRDRTYMDDYICFWFDGLGNQFQYSSWLSAALYDYGKVKGDREWLEAYLPKMIADYRGWEQRRFDTVKGLFWQTPTQDATEFTVAGYMVGNGWKGDAYRPTINTFMYANTRAIEEVARMVGDTAVVSDFSARAGLLKNNIVGLLWDKGQAHFKDRFTELYPDRYFEFIESPELNGYVPWMFSLPPDSARFAAAWEKLMDPMLFYAPYGPRTITADSPYYMRETRTPGAPRGLGECEWNGPSWPYQTSQVLMAMANLLRQYDQDVISPEDYFDILSIYTASQYKDGVPYIAENLDPDSGEWIADFPNRSEHYNHSTYNDIILGGLLGITPMMGDSIGIFPLIPASWDYFKVENLTYHGQLLKIVYDRDGSRYGGPAGLSVYADGKEIARGLPVSGQTVVLPAAVPQPEVKHIKNYAFNDKGHGEPVATASYVDPEDKSAGPFAAVDGRVWYRDFPHNRWSTTGSDAASHWFEVDFGQKRGVNAVNIHLFADDKNVFVPHEVALEWWDGAEWKAVSSLKAAHRRPVPGTVNSYTFDKVETGKFRAVFQTCGKAVALNEIEIGEI